jgi:hypothetical protein
LNPAMNNFNLNGTGSSTLHRMTEKRLHALYSSEAARTINIL